LRRAAPASRAKSNMAISFGEHVPPQGRVGV
jgi:hypothetical protein